MTYAQYYRELFRLFLRLPQNPFFLATLPRRGGLLSRLWFWTNLVLALAAVGVAAALVASRPSEEEAGNLASVFLGISIFAPWVVAWTFFGPASRQWRARHELEELYVTPFAPREIVFGLVAVPAMCTLLLSSGLATGGFLLGLASVGSLEWKRVFDSLEMIAFIGLFHVPTVTAAVTFSTRFGRKFWPVIVFGPLYCIGAISAGAVITEAAENLTELGLGWDERGLLGIVAANVLLVPMMLRGAGRFAGSSFFAQIETVEHARRDPIAGGRRVWWFTPASITHGPLRTCRKPTRVLGPLATWLPIAALAGIACVSGMMNRSAAPEIPEFRFGFHRVFNAWTLGMMMVVQIVTAEFAMLQRGRPIVAGAMLRSIVGPHVRVYLRHALVWCGMAAWVTFLRPAFMHWHQIAGALVLGGLLIPLVAFLASILLACGVLANARHPVIAALPTIAAATVVTLTVVLVGPASYDTAPAPEVTFFWFRDAAVGLALLKLLACWQLLLAPGRLTDIYTRLRIGFAEPGTVLYLRGGKDAAA